MTVFLPLNGSLFLMSSLQRTSKTRDTSSSWSSRTCVCPECVLIDVFSISPPTFKIINHCFKNTLYMEVLPTVLYSSWWCILMWSIIQDRELSFPNYRTEVSCDNLRLSSWPLILLEFLEESPHIIFGPFGRDQPIILNLSIRINLGDLTWSQVCPREPGL